MLTSFAMAFRKCPATLRSLASTRIAAQNRRTKLRCGLRESTPLSGAVTGASKTRAGPPATSRP
jgi:hypothetical protein